MFWWREQDICDEKVQQKKLIFSLCIFELHNQNLIVFSILNIGYMNCIFLKCTNIFDTKKLCRIWNKYCKKQIFSKQKIPNEILNNCSLWQVSNLVIEYSCQDKDKIFATEKVNYDEDWLLKNVQKCEEYWMGNRFAQGY